MALATPLWRVFPWDPDAGEGEPFSASYVPERQGAGRFDIRAGRTLYLAETPEHAVAEKIQRYRGQELDAGDLREFSHPLAIVPVELSASDRERIADLCDLEVLTRVATRPDQVAAHSQSTSQAVAERCFEAGFAGLRWWSVFFGEWHTIALFLSSGEQWMLEYGKPEVIGISHPAVVEAAAVLGVRLPRPQT